MPLSDYEIDRPLEEASTLPKDWYFDSQIFEMEKDRIFFKDWHLVGNTHFLQKPGDFFTFEFLDEPILVTRDLKDRIRAFSNVCRHRAGRLANGRGCTKVLQCQYHGWTYNLEGQLRGAPDFDGAKNWNKEDVRLPEYAVKTWGPFVFINFEKTPIPLETWLKPISQKVEEAQFKLNNYRYLFRRDYHVDCNWKVYVENFQEGYHIPIAHPELNRQIDYRTYRVENHGHFSQHFSSFDREDSEKALWFLIYPDWMLNLYPTYLTINYVIPLSVSTTKVVFEWYVTGDSPLASEPVQEHLQDEEISPALRELIYFSDLIQKEDAQVCHDVQRGLKSRRYFTGRLCPKHESGVHWFQQKVARALQN